MGVFGPSGPLDGFACSRLQLELNELDLEALGCGDGLTSAGTARERNLWPTTARKPARSQCGRMDGVLFLKYCIFSRFRMRKSQTNAQRSARLWMPGPKPCALGICCSVLREQNCQWLVIRKGLFKFAEGKGIRFELLLAHSFVELTACHLPTC